MNQIKRIVNYNIKFGLVNSLRKAIYRLLQIPDALFHFFRKCRFYFQTQCWIQNAGCGLVLRGIGNNVRFGKDTTLYDKVIIEISEETHLRVGDHFILSYGSIIACHHFIEIGNYVMIGEYTSIRDTTHDYATEGFPFLLQRNKYEPIKIGNNVWIGRGCIISPGTIIEEGVIVGANSVVKGHLKSQSIYAGAPLKLIRKL